MRMQRYSIKYRKCEGLWFVIEMNTICIAFSNGKLKGIVHTKRGELWYLNSC